MDFNDTVAGAPCPGEAATLVVVTGKDAGASHRVTADFIIGRAEDADLRINSGDVSRHHARITRTPLGEYVIADLGSKNGIQLNGADVKTATLRFGDRITIGNRVILLFGGSNMLESQLLHSTKMASLGRLAGAVSHDFNNMLGSLTMSIACLRRLPSETALGSSDVDEILQEIEEVVDRATDLTRQLLQTARGGKARESDVDLSKLADQVASMIESTAPDNIVVCREIDSDVTITGDESQIHQVLLNLCSNACDAMPDGGKLRISLRMDESTGARPRAHAVLEIGDTGEGMIDEVRQQAFEPFFSTKPREQATGLGLAAVYGIVQSHDGLVALDTEPGKGTTFRIQLPLRDKTAIDTTTRSKLVDQSG